MAPNSQLNHNLNTVAVLTVHFGKGRWTEHLVEQVTRRCPPVNFRLVDFVVVDNNRDGEIAETLHQYSCVRVLQYPRDEQQFSYYGHDHAASITRGLSDLAESDVVVLFDCDAHPVRAEFWKYLSEKISSYDAILASDRRCDDLSHPCFMAFHGRHRPAGLLFDSGPTYKMDVGRLIRSEIIGRGLAVYTPSVSRAFDGTWGDFLDDVVYHHGSGTFRFSDRHSQMVHPYSEYFERIVLRKRRYKLSISEKMTLSMYVRILQARRMLRCAACSR